MVTLSLPLCKVSSGRWKRKHTPHANHRAARVYTSTLRDIFQSVSASVFSRLKIELDRPEKTAAPASIDEQRRPLPTAGFDDRPGLLYHRHITASTPRPEESLIVQSQSEDCAFHKMEGD